MAFLACGIVAFLLFVGYDIADVTGRFKALRIGFFWGCLLLLLSTAGLVWQALRTSAPSPIRLGIFGSLALLFLLLLLYSLFFALPFSSTYAHTSPASLHVYCDGVYALCRHPGVLWLTGFYGCLWLALGTGRLLAAFLLYSLLDVLYVWLQDKWTFPHLFSDYAAYRETTPFLLPSGGSIRRCLRTLQKRRD